MNTDQDMMEGTRHENWYKNEIPVMNTNRRGLEVQLEYWYKNEIPVKSTDRMK